VELEQHDEGRVEHRLETNAEMLPASLTLILLQDSLESSVSIKRDIVSSLRFVDDPNLSLDLGTVNSDH
jgi:hypothetical protein